MNYTQKKAHKLFLKNFDQKYLGGIIARILRGNPKMPVSKFVLTPEAKEIAQKELMLQIERPLPTDRELKRVEILVLNYKAPEIEAECARRLIQHTNWPYKLNLFDNRDR